MSILLTHLQISLKNHTLLLTSFRKKEAAQLLSITMAAAHHFSHTCLLLDELMLHYIHRYIELQL
jgi:hypothetical protein